MQRALAEPLLWGCSGHARLPNTVRAVQGNPIKLRERIKELFRPALGEIHRAEGRAGRGGGDVNATFGPCGGWPGGLAKCGDQRDQRPGHRALGVVGGASWWATCQDWAFHQHELVAAGLLESGLFALGAALALYGRAGSVRTSPTDALQDRTVTPGREERPVISADRNLPCPRES